MCLLVRGSCTREEFPIRFRHYKQADVLAASCGAVADQLASRVHTAHTAPKSTGGRGYGQAQVCSSPTAVLEQRSRTFPFASSRSMYVCT